MAATRRTPEDWISFLLTLMDHTDAKPNWNEVANTTGCYKSGKFVRQAYDNLRKKYHPLAAADGASTAPKTPKSTKKREKATTDENNEEEEKKPKRARNIKGATKKEAVKEDEDSDEKSSIILKREDLDGSEDELNGVSTLSKDREH